MWVAREEMESPRQRGCSTVPWTLGHCQVVHSLEQIALQSTAYGHVPTVLTDIGGYVLAVRFMSRQRLTFSNTYCSSRLTALTQKTRGLDIYLRLSTEYSSRAIPEVIGQATWEGMINVAWLDERREFHGI